MSGERGATSGTSGDCPSGSGDAEDEEDLYLPPRLRGNHLIVNFPLKVPINCLVGKCGTRIKNKTWTASVNNFKRHMNEIHNLNIEEKRTNWCSVCDCNIGRQPATHACFRERPFFVVSGEKVKFKCDQCRETYPTWRGLSSHKSSHHAKQI